MAEGRAQLEQQVQTILESIKDPTGRGLLTAGLIASAGWQGEVLVLTCRSQGLPEPIRQRLEREIRNGLAEKLPQVDGVRVVWEGGSPAAGHGHAHPSPQQETAPPPDIRHIIAVGSGKGGVGKSTVAASLAYALKHRGFSVGLMDADVYGPSIPHMLGIPGERPSVVNNRYQPPVVDGIPTMSMGLMVAPEQAVVWRGPMLHKAVRDFLYMVQWGSLDFLIVDLPPGTGDVVLSLSQQMPLTGGVIVCTPQDVALLDAKKALSMFQTVHIPCRGIVENMSLFVCPDCGSRHEIFGHGGARAWAAEAGIPFLGSLPINISVRIHGDEGRLRDNFDASSPVRETILAIADQLVAGIQAGGKPQVPTLEVVE